MASNYEIVQPIENNEGEIETLEEFLLEVEDKNPKDIKFDGWTFTDIDFRDKRIIESTWKSYNFKNSVFYGCILPTFDDAARIRDQGAHVAFQREGIPFKTFRAFMYKQQELIRDDAKIYEYYLSKTDLNSRLFMQMHDYFVQDALFDYLEGKTVVAIMGGHAMKRSDESYEAVVRLSWKLAKNGFIVASGGGPGAMEASNLGAYLYERTEAEVEEALQIIKTVRDATIDLEYKDTSAPKAVIERFGWPEHQPSLSIPTWKYGHEPSNMFATWVAKLFSNAIREDGLLDIATGGIIYTPGSAGTRQEIFQAACTNHYAKEGKEKPTIFYDTEFWTKTEIPKILKMLSKDKPFAKWIRESDDIDNIVKTLVEFRAEIGLPIVTVKQLKSKFWMKQTEDKEPEEGANEHSKEFAMKRKERRKQLLVFRKEMHNVMASRETDCCEIESENTKKRKQLAA